MARVEKLVEADGWTEWVTPEPSDFRLFCCDCGLSHDLQFRLGETGEIQFRLSRNDRATAAMRRETRKRETKEQPNADV